MSSVSADHHPAAQSSSSSSFSYSESEIIEQLRQKLGAMEQQLAVTEQRLQYSELKVQVLEEQLRRERIDKYGRSSEKLSNEQLELLELEPGVSNEEVAAEAQREALPQPSTSQPRKQHPGRQRLPEGLPRVEWVIPCSPEQSVCRGCGKATVVIGHEESEQLDVEPAKYFVLVTKREKRACKKCEEQGVMAAPLPARIIEKGLVSDRVVIDTIVSKYVDHCPLYRQSAILKREADLDLSRATLDGWVMRVGELLRPVVGVMRRELVAGSYIQADETPIAVQTQDGRGKNHQAYLWQYGSPGREAIFDFRMGRGREGPQQFLKDFTGILQTDGYAAYNQVGKGRVVRAGCWSHARRKFFEAAQLNPDDKAAVAIVAKIDELFAVDAEARAQQMNLEARHQLRQQKARPLLDEIRALILAANRSALPQSALGKAASYTLSLWERLTRFLEYPVLELSTNLAENSMRPIVLGRKNWLHLGSEQAGPKIAAILSIVESCRRKQIPVRNYLADVLPGLNDLSIQRIAELTPKSWATKHLQH
jgi:transposase